MPPRTFEAREDTFSCVEVTKSSIPATRLSTRAAILSSWPSRDSSLLMLVCTLLLSFQATNINPPISASRQIAIIEVATPITASQFIMCAVFAKPRPYIYPLTNHLGWELLSSFFRRNERET